MFKLLTICACLLSVFILPSQLLAGAMQDIGYDASAVGGANGDIVFGKSYGVIFSNPAIMSRIRPHGGIGFTLYKPEMKVKLKMTAEERTAAGLDIPYAIFNAVDKAGAYSWETPNRPQPTVNLPHRARDTSISAPQTAITAGGLMDFGLPGFRLGGALVLPMIYQANLNTHYYDEREADFSNQIHPARFGEWSPVVTGLVGASYCPHFFDYISLGLALQISITTKADVDLYMADITSDDYSNQNVGMKAGLKFRPIVGLQAEMPHPVDFWALGFTWRNESYIDVDGSGVMELRGYFEPNDDPQNMDNIPRVVEQKFKMALDYEPMEVAAGTGFRYKGWNSQIGVTWSRWSKFRDPHGETPQRAAVWQDKRATKYSDESSSYYGTYSFGDNNHFQWKDTVNVTANTSYNYLEEIGVNWVSMRLGFAYKPSPVPVQEGRTNYADTDTWCAAFGHRIEFDIKDRYRFWFDLGLQLWLLAARNTYKIVGHDADGNPLFYDEFPDTLVDKNTGESFVIAQGLQTNNPGFPGYRLSGWMLVTSATVNLEF